MKKYFFLAAAAVAILLLAGCEREVIPVSQDGMAEAVPVWFEQVGGPSTKVDIDGDTGAGTWTVGDSLAIYVEGTGANFYQIKPVKDIVAGNENTGSVTVPLAAGQNRANYAIYPASARVDDYYSDATGLYIKYPSSYDYSKLTVAEMETFSPTPMVAVNEPVLPNPSSPAPTLYFYHVGGVLRLTIPQVQQSAYSLRIIFPEDLNITGTYEVANGGTTDATLTPVGSDHGNVIDIKIPVLETTIQDLVLNIPVPQGTYVPSDRNYRVEVRTQKIAYMESGGVINFKEFMRAEGKKENLPPVKTTGSMGGVYVNRGYLKRAIALSTNVGDVYISGTDQLEVYSYSGVSTGSLGRNMYFSWKELGKIMTGNSSFNGGSTGFESATLTINNVSYRVPTQEEWISILQGGLTERPGATVNGSSGKRYSTVSFSISDKGYGSFTTASGLLIYPDGGAFDCDNITSYNSTTVNSITYADYRRLTDGPNACLFLPRAGVYYTNGNAWSYGGSMGWHWSSSASSDTGAYYAKTDGSVGSDSQTCAYPIRLVRVEE